MLLDRASKRFEEKPVVLWRIGGRLLGVVLCLVLSGCETMRGFACSSGEQRGVQEFVYFGTDTPSGSVSPEDWARFLREVVISRFSEGLSVWQASGQWRGVSGVMVNESTYVLSLIHPDDAATNRAMQDILASYKTRFQQEAVLRVTTPVCTSL